MIYNSISKIPIYPARKNLQMPNLPDKTSYLVLRMNRGLAKRFKA